METFLKTLAIGRSMALEMSSKRPDETRRKIAPEPATCESGKTAFLCHFSRSESSFRTNSLMELQLVAPTPSVFDRSAPAPIPY
jgi:hypothetical protein